jgi:hypothetical protein
MVAILNQEIARAHGSNLMQPGASFDPFFAETSIPANREEKLSLLKDY